MRKLLLPILSALTLALAIAAPSSSAATGFCGGSNVNNSNKCYGANRVFEWARAYGDSTGVCVGFDNTQGTCAGTYDYAYVYPHDSASHYPYIVGTDGAFTVAHGETNP